MKEPEHKYSITEGNLTITIEHTGLNDLDVSTMLEIFGRLLKSAGYVFDGSVIVDEDDLLN